MSDRRFAPRRDGRICSARAYAAERAVSALAPFSWLRADSYTASGGKVTAFLDRVISGHSLSQATDANRVATPTADSALAGAVSADMSGAANTISYSSSLAASSWKFLHSGSGCEMFFVYVPTNTGGTATLYATRGTLPGTDYLFNTVGNVRNANDASIYSNLTVSSVHTNGVGTYMNYSFNESASPKMSLRYKTGTPSTSSPATAPSTNDPSATFRLGTSGSNAQRWADAIFFDRVLTASERSTVQAYMLARYALQ